MAVLKDLIVHGRSRFVNGIDADSIHANLIDANDGVFKTITTTTLDAETITTDMLKANNARVSQTLTVDGTISTNKWEAANIANIGGNFYISPTGKSDSGTITVTKTSSTTINGVTVGVYTVVVSGTFGVTSTSSTVWGPTSSNQSKVIFTGSISYNNSKKYPLGTCNGTLTTLSTGTNTLTGFTITGINSPALDIFFQEVGVSSVSSTACNGYEMQISVYQTYYNSNLRPVGILLTSYGKEKKQYIDIYNGENTLGDSASGFANPAVRIGLLDDLPNIVDNSTDTATKPSGWGIYTTNGFFKGKVVANAGRIATWNIGSTSIYSGTNSMTSTTQGTYIGTGTDATSGIRNYKDANTFVNISQGVITAKAVDLTGKITASSGSIGGWNIGTETTNKSLYYGNQTPGATTTNLVLSPTSATNSNAIGGSGTGLTWFISAGKVFGVTTAGALYSTSGKIGGFDIGATYLRNGNITSATNTSVAGVYLGTDGLNISNGTAATTSYITKTAVNIGNKLTWNGTTLTIDGSASIGGTTASTVVSNAANGAAAKTGLDNLEIGGRNLLHNSADLTKWPHPSCTTVWDETEGMYKVIVTAANTWWGIYEDVVVEPNTEYTVSVTGKKGTGNYTSIAYGGNNAPDWGAKKVDFNTTAERKFITFTTGASQTSMRISFVIYTDSNGSNYGWFLKPKLEKGNKATDWSPAPEDLDVHKYVTDIDTNNGITIKAINGTADTNTTTGNYIKLNASGLDIYNKGASVAFYGATARVGKSSTARVEIDSSPYVNLYNSSNKLALSIQGSGLFMYDQNSYKRAGVTSNGFILYDGASSSTTTQLGSFTASSGNATIKLGQEATNKFNILITDSAVSGKGPGILLRQGTNVLNEITTNGMNLYLASDTTNSIAEFGETARIGKTSSGHVNVTPDGIELWGQMKSVTDHTFIHSQGVAVGLESDYGSIELGPVGGITGSHDVLDDNTTRNQLYIDSGTTRDTSSNLASILMEAYSSENNATIGLYAEEGSNGKSSIEISADKIFVNSDALEDYVIEKSTVDVTSRAVKQAIGGTYPAQFYAERFGKFIYMTYKIGGLSFNASSVNAILSLYSDIRPKYETIIPVNITDMNYATVGTGLIRFETGGWVYLVAPKSLSQTSGLYVMFTALYLI